MNLAIEFCEIYLQGTALTIKKIFETWASFPDLC